MPLADYVCAMRIWLSGPRLLGGLVRAGIGFSPKALRTLAAAPFQPDWFDLLALRMIVAALLIFGGLVVFVFGAAAWALLFH